ncbi:hypothetical protein BA746_00400 [Vibrio parahaemolyticus]|uniref:pyocin knob domain-containing protein n=1 Tax=Vibrio parahaemolyticus TaxID=670 RepID=UPI0006A6226B|nr:pyocin knob domain-containing protein [Vibrio parahaemolyticus]OTW07829.1 hypothetical protein BA743_16395 [Vibrio parahaemolyticus]OTW23936.1 hypothetical protein BA744_00980 [Vibrio parahaemolyticus]OTW27254.1 hypothetical protein BA746_00400 [Vibrio parahaemolyticus]
MLKMNKPTPVERVGYTASNSVPHSMKITVEQELPFNARTLKVLVNKELPLNNGISIGSDKATGIIDSKHVVRVLEGVNIADALMVMLHRETKQMHGEVIEAHECIHTDKAQVFAKVAEAELSASNAKASELKAKQSETNAANSASSALTSKNAAKLSETNAANSEQAAKESELAAQESEETALVHRTHALESKTAAKVSETNAKASELAAKASETQANASATTATNEASKAATSASAALASETNAKKSETNAKASELAADADAKQVAVDRVATAQAMEQTEQYKDAASLAASNAAASEVSALASKNAAKTSETNALASKNSAASSANLAQSKATEAGTYADSASASAAAAKASETNAKNSEINAGTSASAAGSDASIAAEKAATAIAKADEANASANVAVEAAKRAETAMAAISGALVEMGFCDLSGGVYPTPLTDTNGNKHSCFWKVTKGGTVNGVVYGVGDSLVFSVELNDYYKIDNTESVTSVNGKQGAVTINAEDVGAYSKSQVPTWAQVGLKSGGKFRAVGKTDGGSEQTDPNTLDLSGAGFHQKLTHEVNGNAPSCGTGYSYLQQICYGTSGNVTQIAYPYGTSGRNGRLGYRTKYGEVWNPWEYIYSTANKPTWEDVGGTAYIKSDDTYLQIGQAKWLRAGGTSYGFLPSAAGKYAESKSSLGSTTWWFANAFVNNYRGGNISVDKYYLGAWTLDEHSNGNLEILHGETNDLALHIKSSSKDLYASGAIYENGADRVYSTANKPTAADVGAQPKLDAPFSTREYKVSKTLNPELLNSAGHTLGANTSYLVRMVTRATGTTTGAVYVVEVNASGVIVLTPIALRGTTSNHPMLKVVDGKVVIYTNHDSEYGILVMMQEVASSSPNNAFLAEKSFYSPLNKPTANELGALPISGGELTGGLTVPNSLYLKATSTGNNANLFLRRPDNTNAGVMYWDKSDESIRINNYAANGSTVENALAVKDSTTESTKNIVIGSAQLNQDNALTRKDYVDGQVNTRLPLAGGTITGNLEVGSSKFLMNGVNMMGASDTVTRFGDGTYARPIILNAKDGVVNVANGSTLSRVYHEGYKPTANDVNAIPVDKLHGTPVAAYYLTRAANNVGTKIRLPFKTNAGKMVTFSVRIYQGYKHYDIQFSGYLYATTNQWHAPQATMNGGTDTIAVKMGRDTDGTAYVWLAGGSYRGVAVFNVVGGHSTADWNTGWTITESDDAPNVAMATTLHPPVSSGGDVMTGTLAIQGLHATDAVAADAFKASGYGIMANRAVMYVHNANADGKVSIGVGGRYGENVKLSVSSSGVESVIPITVKHEVNVTPATGDASINMSTPANKNSTIRMREDGNKHGAYIQYRGANENDLVIGTYQDGSSTMAMSIPRGKSDVNFENNIYVKGGQVNLVNKFRLIGETNGVKINSVTHGKNAWFGSRNTSWFHIETDATSGFYSYSSFEFARGINVHSDVGIKIAGKEAVKGDSWLRLNPSGQFSSGVYFGNVGIVRTDNQLHIGDWTNQNKTAKVNKDFYDTTWGGNGVAAYNLRCADSVGAHWAFASYYDTTNIRSGIQILSDATGKMRFYTNRRSNYVELHSGNVFAGAGQSNASNAYTRKDYVDSKIASLGRGGEVAIGSNAPRAAADSIGISGQVWGCKDWSGKYQDPFGLATYVSITDGFRIISTGYYELEWTAYRRSHGSDSVCKSAIGKNKSSLLTMTQGLSNDYDATPVTCRWVGKLNANDTIQFLDMGASAPIEGSHFAIRFIKP